MRLHNFIVQFRVLSLLYSPLVVFVSLLMARGKQESVEVKQKWEVCVSLQHELYRNPFVDKNHRLWIAISLYFPLCYLYVNVFHYFGFVAKAVSKDSISIAMVFSKGLCNDWLSTDSPTIQEYVYHMSLHICPELRRELVEEKENSRWFYFLLESNNNFEFYWILYKIIRTSCRWNCILKLI